MEKTETNIILKPKLLAGPENSSSLVFWDLYKKYKHPLLAMATKFFIFDLPLHITKSSAFIVSGDSSHLDEYTKQILRKLNYFKNFIKPK